MGKYKIYHIPGQKVGCTSNIAKRVEQTQGYKQGEYEILEETDDIVDASKLERFYQKHLGYKTDRTLYHKLVKRKKRMHTNTTSFTTTFYKPKDQIKPEDIHGLTIETEQGTYDLDTEDKIDWVIGNLLPSQFTPKRCFVYNKAMSEASPFLKPSKAFNPTEDIEIFSKIRAWAWERGIYDKGDPKTQLIKLYEEAGELAQSTLKQDREGIIDAIGDCIVVLTNLAHLNSLRIEDCVGAAYDEISSRTGEMKNGTFVKDN